MLGRFLELALVTEDTSAAWLQLQELGFAAATAGDVWNYPYGVVACEGLAIGLHGAGNEALSLTFVKQDVAALERALTMFRFEIEHVRLGNDVFNELVVREPGGVALRVIGARTFSPPAEVPGRTELGVFRSISLPCADLDEARGFWELLGMELRDVEMPWEGFAVEGMPLAYHARESFREPLLWFEGDTAGEVQPSLGGVAVARPIATLRGTGHRLVRGPGGLAMMTLLATDRE